MEGSVFAVRKTDKCCGGVEYRYLVAVLISSESDACGTLSFAMIDGREDSRL